MNDSNDNISAFNDCVAIIFGELYKMFPIPITLNYNDLAIVLFSEEDEVLTHEKNLDVFRHTLIWLKNSGYVSYEHEKDLHAYNVVLSAKGLEVLKVVPKSIKQRISIGDALLSITKDSAKESRSSLISIALTEGYRLLTQ